MKKFAIMMFVIILVLSFSACAEKTEGKPIVAAGIVPAASFIEAIAGDIVDVVTLIPPGNSPANYQPSSKEMQELSDAVVYFTMQMPTEEANILPKVRDFNDDIIIINLRDAVSQEYELRMIEGHDHGDDHDDGDEHDDGDDHDDLSVDPHIWLSPKNAVVIVQAIADELVAQFPDHTSSILKNAIDLISDINDLDAEIASRIENLPDKSFMIYHGAYGYFADSYNLDMISIEVAGKQATAAEIQEVIEHANEDNIKVVFYQDEFDDSQAQTIAEEIDGRVAKASPLSPDYIGSLLDFVKALEGAQD